MFPGYTGPSPRGIVDTPMWITGHVIDERGHALSGVTIEASTAADARIRAAVTNEQGAYVIQDLRPEPYTLTFARAGFATLQRTVDRVPLFAATINAKLTAGSV